MNDIEHIIPPIAQALGIEPATALLLLGVIIAIANLLGRLIPDDKVGVLGTIRKVCKFIGLYASNRISSGLTVNEIAKTTVPIIENIGEVQEQMESKLSDAAAQVVKAFPGVDKGPERDPVTGQFKKGKS